MANAPQRGPEVSGQEALLRGIFHPNWWDPDSKCLSSGVFGFPKFSAFVESLTDTYDLLQSFPDGSGTIRFNAGAARELGFDARHEPEEGNDAHANVYCDLSSSQRKKRARKLVEASQLIAAPDNEKLHSSR